MHLTLNDEAYVSIATDQGLCISMVLDLMMTVFMSNSMLRHSSNCLHPQLHDKANVVEILVSARLSLCVSFTRSSFAGSDYQSDPGDLLSLEAGDADVRLAPERCC